MIQDIPDVDWMLRPDVQWAFAALQDLDLTFDALGFSRHLANFLTIFKRYPNLRVVVDHCMKPQIRNHKGAQNEFAFWSEGISRIAQETGAFCKLSGIITEADANWTVTDLQPYAAHVLERIWPGARHVGFRLAGLPIARRVRRLAHGRKPTLRASYASGAGQCFRPKRDAFLSALMRKRLAQNSV